MTLDYTMGFSNECKTLRARYLLVGCLCSAIAASVVTAFVPNFPTKEFRRTARPSVLQTSLSTPPETIQGSGDDDKDIISHRSSDRSQFRSHLRAMKESTRSKVTLANRMDDELKRMETRFFKLSAQDAPTCRYEPTTHTYSGPAVEPDVSCYAMVATAYAKSGLGKTGAELAEQVYERCQLRSVAQPPNAVLKTACLSAWTSADEWAKADAWLKEMETTFAETGEKFDAPDTVTYTCYLEGLSNSRKLKGPIVQQRGQKMFEKVQNLSKSGDNPYVKPNRFTYIAAMKCLGRGENGTATIDQTEGLLRELEALYEDGGHPDMKPKTMAYLAALNAASRCGAGIVGARRAEKLLHELRKLNENDSDYRLLEPCWTACLTAYARVESEYAAECAAKVEGILEMMENDKSLRRPSVHVYTAGKWYTGPISQPSSYSSHCASPLPFILLNLAINAKVNDSDPRSVEDAAAILRSLKKPDSIAYQCGK